MGGRAAFKELIFCHDVYHSQMTRRRLVLLWGVCRFSIHFCYFSWVLFGGKEIFRIFVIKLREICYAIVAVDFLL